MKWLNKKKTDEIWASLKRSNMKLLVWSLRRFFFCVCLFADAPDDDKKKFFCRCSFRDVLVNNAVANMPRHSSLSVTVCEPAAMSEAVVMEASRADGFLESSCAVGDSAASLDDAILDTAKYVHINTFTLTPLSRDTWFPTWALEEGSFLPV